jgi:protein phosphatase
MREKHADHPFTLVWHGITDIGMVRARNEDSLAHRELGRDALLVVADGMGGHDAGEVASGIAVDTVCSMIQEAGPLIDDPLRLVEQALQRANRSVKDEAARTGSNMGTTLTAALVIDGTAYIGSVGDSRAYWIRNGSISRITTDHSLVARLVATGMLTEEEARLDPRSHLLLRTIGSEDTVKVDTYQVPLARGETLLLCTDGLWGAVEDEEIRRICSEEEHTEVICARLVQQANGNGGKDNITAIALKVT